jgi:ribosomal protein S1
VDVIGHDDVSGDVKLMSDPGLFEDFREGVSGRGSAEDWAVANATEGDEVEVACLVVSLEPERHEGSLGEILEFE